MYSRASDKTNISVPVNLKNMFAAVDLLHRAFEEKWAYCTQEIASDGL